VAIDLIGRTHEIEQLDRFLASLAAQPPSPVGLVLQGPAGIGKSSLWTAAGELAGARGVRVLEARPSEAEVSFAFQALSDLLEPLHGELASIPAPQRRSLEVALLREDAAGDSAPELQTIAAGATSLVRSAARRGPILIAVDDAQWLDEASASAIEFVVRRLADRSVGVLLTQRVDSAGAAPLALDRAMPTERLWLGPLGRANLHELLAQRLGLVLPRATLARLHEESQGNPFHALEIARALQRLPAMPKPGDPLPVPESVRELIGGRLAALSPSARRVLLLAAVAGAPTVERIAAALGPEAGTQSALDAAAEAGLVAVDGQTVRFTHPLIASTVVATAEPAARREAHRALARVVSEPETRGRHLALSTTSADAGVAAALEEAALDAERRGASHAAVELHRLAVDLTPSAAAGDTARREARLAIALVLQADLNEAKAILDRTIPRLPLGTLKAEACLTRATIAWYFERSVDAVAHLEAALRALGREPDDATTPDDPEVATLVGRIHLRIAQFMEDLAGSWPHRLAAAKLLEEHGARTSYATALMMVFWAEVNLGRAADLPLLERALAIEEGGHEDSSTLPGFFWMYTDRPDLARARFLWMRQTGEEIGEFSGDADVATQLAQVEILADDGPRARAYIEEARMLWAQEGQHERLPLIRTQALLDAHVGRLAEAETAARAGLARAVDDGATIVGVAFLQILALVAASRGDHAAVLEWTAKARGLLDSISWVDGLRLDPLPERAEALAHLGRLDDAAAALAELQQREAVLHRPYLVAAIARVWALLALARGDEAAAVAATEAAMDDRSVAWRSFDRARTQLVRGQVLLRVRRPRDAGVALDAALETFERIGARAWAERTRTELRRLGRRRTTSDDLTPAEAQVAALAASGLRNHEVAARLGVSPKTVEAHLARVYAKLDIRSRAELGRAIAPGEG
jgi:DNA-binding CsgD family transcriptional regulator